MADQGSHPSPAEQRMRAVAKLKRAASLPRMKDGRRPPMHVEAMSEGEKAQSEEDKAGSDAEKLETPEDLTIVQRVQGPGEDVEQVEVPPEAQEKTSELDLDHRLPSTEKASDVDLEADTELEEPALTPAAVFKKRRTRSRSRSRGSKDFKAKMKASQPSVAQVGGDSSPDENPPVPSSVMLSMIPPLLSPIPHFPFLQQSRFLPSPASASPEMSLFYPVTSPPTPLPSLEEIQKGLMRSNSAGSSAAGRRMAMHKLTGGTETYEPSSSPTPPPSLPKLSRNNTVAGGERIAARQHMLSRLGTRITKEADAEGASGAEDRGGAPSPTPKRRRRRSRRTSVNAAVSDSDFNSNSTNPNTPAFPPTPLPTLLHHFIELRAQSTTPNQLSSLHTQSREQVSDSTLPPLPVPILKKSEEEEVEPERPEQTRRRSVLIEDPDEEEKDPPDQRYTASPLPGTPQRTFQTVEAIRSQYVTDTLSNGFSDASIPGASVPSFLNQRAPSRNDMFPSSPFMTPLNEKLNEKPLNDEDEVLYPASTIRPRTPYANVIDSYEREISWVASPVPEIRMPIDDDEEDEPGQEVDVQDAEAEDEEAPLSTASSNGFLPETFEHEERDDTSPRASSSSKSVLVESETSPEVPYASASDPSADLALPRPCNESISSQFYPTRLSVASQRSPLYTEFSEPEDRPSVNDAAPKRPEPSTSTTWEKVKSTFSRAGSSSGRRSRTNSIATRERHSSVSRESGASLLSSKTDKGENGGPTTQPQALPLMQSPSASASILSLVPHPPPRGSVSPIPPPSSADMSKYQHAKLFPFPGMLKLEEERRKVQLPFTSSTPDVSAQSNTINETQGSCTSHSNANRTPDANGERRQAQQNVDDVRSGMDFASASPYHQEYVDLLSSSQQNGTHSKLPTTLPGVKQWLSKNLNKKPVSTSSPGPGSVPLSPSSATEVSTLTLMDSPTVKKPSISDLFPKKAVDDWDEFGKKLPNSVAETPITPLDRPYTNSIPVNGTNGVEMMESSRHLMKGHNLFPLDVAAGRGSPYRFPYNPSSSVTRSATPDPSSLSDYPAPTASEHSSTPSSQYSLKVSSGAAVVERLEELLRGTKCPTWLFTTDNTPRKLSLSGLVLQVVNPNTVKDRFLFLFDDILVIAKPVTSEQDNLMDNSNVSVADRKYIVKTVVQLRHVRFSADRSENQGKTSSLGISNPLVRSFISQFAKDPDYAISTLPYKPTDPNDAVLLGHLFSRILDLDRSCLGEYLARKSSKAILKSYLDSFGFAGLRVDVALRVFLHSVNLSRHSHYQAALESLLESFANRWYEANAKFVAYDKDMALRLVWALAQLNDRLHGGIADEPGPTGHGRRNVTSKEFLDAFRRYDVRKSVSDDLLGDLYKSIYHERLCQACARMPSGPQDTPITIKRALPTRLTYNMQSDPVVFRLPQADPLLSIELYGQDMEFDPPVLHFAKSSEASFRVVGKSLGPKTITMCRSGPNAVKYSGLLSSHTIVVERAFMRNTFQLAFMESNKKRRYMFSVADTIIRTVWLEKLQHHIDSAIALARSQVASAITDPLKLYRAVDDIAFKVLRDSLMGHNQSPNTHRTNGSASTQSSDFSPYTHTRSKSRSRIYHQHGPGKNELELQHSSSYDSNDYSPESSDQANTPEQSQEGMLWTSRDILLHCVQNGSISTMLSLLQVGTAEGATLRTTAL